MISSGRDILVVLKSKSITDNELQLLHRILNITESSDVFCKAYELVDRNRITTNPQKILKESRRYFLRPFRFLINKN